MGQIFFFFPFLAALQCMGLPGQGSDWSHRDDLGCHCGSSRYLTPCVGPGIEPASPWPPRCQSCSATAGAPLWAILTLPGQALQPTLLPLRTPHAGLQHPVPSHPKLPPARPLRHCGVSSKAHVCWDRFFVPALLFTVSARGSPICLVLHWRACRAEPGRGRCSADICWRNDC